LKILRLYSFEYTHNELLQLARQLEPFGSEKILVLPLTRDPLVGNGLEVLYLTGAEQEVKP